MPHTLKRAWWSGKVVSPTPERPRNCRRQMILPRTLTECQLLKIYLSIDLVADLIHPPISEATIMPNARRGRGFHFSCSMSRSLGPGFGFWFGFGCGVGLALTCVMTTAPDDDEWGLIVAYKSSACSHLESPCSGRRVPAQWLCLGKYQSINSIKYGI